MGSARPNLANSRKLAYSRGLAVYTMRVDREQLDRLSEIAAGEHRTLVQKLRLMIDLEIAAYEAEQAAA